MRKLLKILVVLGLVLAPLFYGGGGWYFSSVIRSDALENTPWEQFFDTEVVAFDGATVTLTEGSHSDDELFESGVYGFEWPAGYGQVGPTIESRGGTVTREFSLISGVNPSIGALGDVEAIAFPSDPGALGRTWEPVEYESELGPMGAWRVDGDGSTWAILVHGKGAGIDEGLRMLSAMAVENLPSLMISYRNDPGEPEDPSGFYRYGQTEWRDLQGAIAYAREQGAEDLVLVGFSTGAAIVLSYLENADPATNVKGLIFDSPNIDFGATVDYNASQRTLPGIGTKLPQSLTSVAKLLASWRFDVDWSAINYLGRDLHPIPTLAFHGTADLTVPVETARRLVRAMPATTRLVEVEGAPHVGSWNADPQEYERQVTDFLASVRG